MSFRMSKKVKSYLVDYIHEYAKRILDSKNDIKILNHFDSVKATQAVTKAMLKKEDLSEHEKESIQTEEGQKRIKEFFDEKLLVNYFMFARNISYYESKSLLTDKGVSYFPETKEIKTDLYPGRYKKDYKATDKQLFYLQSFGIEIKHEEELSAREASLIISCLKTPTKTKPGYYSYYIKL